MRFAVLTNVFPPDGKGGAERIAFLQADALACLGHDVRVWAPGTGTAIERTVVHGMEVMRFPSPFAALDTMEIAEKIIFHLLTDAGINRAVSNDIIAWKPDVLLTHNLTGCGMGTARAVQWHNIKWIHTLHDIQLTDPSGQAHAAIAQTLTAKSWYAFWSWWRRKSFGKPDVLVSPTQWLLDWHARMKFTAPKAVVIPNPIDIEPPRDRSLTIPATIAYVGRLSQDKGFDIFLKAVKQLDSSMVGKIVIVGDGPLKEAAQQLGDPRMDLRGALSPEEAHQVIANADLLIAPSQILENQQTILLEAMAEGTPAIVTDVGGTKETLQETGCPMIPATGDQSTAIANAVIQMLSHPDDWKKISLAMYSRARRHEREKYFDALLRNF